MVKYKSTWQHYFGHNVLVNVEPLRRFNTFANSGLGINVITKRQATLIANYLFSNDADIWSFFPTNLQLLKAKPLVDCDSPSTASQQWRTQKFCSGGGGVQQILLRTEDRENRDLGAVAP